MGRRGRRKNKNEFELGAFFRVASTRPMRLLEECIDYPLPFPFPNFSRRLWNRYGSRCRTAVNRSTSK